MSDEDRREYTNAVRGADDTAELVISSADQCRAWYQVKGLGWETSIRGSLEEVWKEAFDIVAKIVGDIESAHIKAKDHRRAIQPF
jgi:hypothetical protein